MYRIYGQQTENITFSQWEYNIYTEFADNKQKVTFRIPEISGVQFRYDDNDDNRVSCISLNGDDDACDGNNNENNNNDNDNRQHFVSYSMMMMITTKIMQMIIMIWY